MEPNFKQLIEITNRLFDDFTANGMKVTQQMVSDLWMSIDTEDGEEAMKRYVEFCNKFDLVSTKVLGGLRDAFEEYTQNKDQLLKVAVEMEKNGHKFNSNKSSPSIVMTTRDAAERYGVNYQTLRKWITRHQLKQANRKSPMMYYVMDIESMLVANDALDGYSQGHIELQSNTSRALDTDNYFNKINGVDEST